MRRFLGLLIAALVVMRGVIPAGFMPVSDKRGFLDIVMCAERSAASTGLGEDGKPTDSQKKTKIDKGLCPFAAVTWLTLGAQSQTVFYPLAATSPLSPPFTERVAILRFASDASARSPPPSSPITF